MGTLQLFAVVALGYVGYRYVRTSIQKNLPKQIDNITSSYQEIMGEPLPEEAQATLKRINDFFKPSTTNFTANTYPSRSVPKESFDTIPSHPFSSNETSTPPIDSFPESNASIQTWINRVPIASVVLSDFGNSRASINGKAYRQGEVINSLYQLKWVQSAKTPDGSIRLYFATPDGKVYIRDF